MEQADAPDLVDLLLKLQQLLLEDLELLRAHPWLPARAGHLDPLRPRRRRLPHLVGLLDAASQQSRRDVEGRLVRADGLEIVRLQA